MKIKITPELLKEYQRVLSSHAGSFSSEKKAKAARLNGKLGGRPLLEVTKYPRKRKK